MSQCYAIVIGNRNASRWVRVCRNKTRMEEAIDKTLAAGGRALVIDPKNGHLLADLSPMGGPPVVRIGVNTAMPRRPDEFDKWRQS